MSAPRVLSTFALLALAIGCRDRIVYHDVGPADSGSVTVDGGTQADAGACVNPSTCAQAFSYPYGGESSVELHGDFNQWGPGVPMRQQGTQWVASVSNLMNGQMVAYKFLLDGTSWTTDPSNARTEPDGVGGQNSVLTVNCDVCAPPNPGPDGGVFDWRDAVIYFVFVDRFLNGDPSNDCNVSGTETTAYTSTNYLGGDWAGVTQKINAGYFNALGVNTLWINVPLKNADSVAEQGVNGDTHTYSAYHGYWPLDPNQRESCFGSDADLSALVQAAHAKGLRVLFDYAMVHVHTSSTIYQQHQNDGWFTGGSAACICGSSTSCPFDTTCWFAPYLAHYDYTNDQARTFSVDAAIQLIQQTGNDAFRLDAIKQVDPSWLGALRPAVSSQILANQNPPQRFYMVGETYDFQNRALIKSMVDPQTQLDGQFDFPLRLRIVEAVLMRSTQNMLTLDDLTWSRTARPGMAGLSDFMDANDGYYGPNAVMSTFLGNHDMPRAIHFAEDVPLWSNCQACQPNPSATNGQAPAVPNAWDSPPPPETESNAFERVANAFAVLFTNVGAPLIYYGDEIGMAGAGDPDNRRMMQWTGYSADQQALLARLQALGAIRAAHPALRRGTRKTLFVDEDLWVYEMSTTGDTLYVAINRSDSDRSTPSLPSGLTELLTQTPEANPVVVPARQTRIFF